LAARPALILWVVGTSVLKALARNTPSIPLAKTEVETETVPAFALRNEEIEMAGF